MFLYKYSQFFYTVYTQDTNTTSIFHNNLIVKIIILHTKSCFGKLLVHNTDPVTARMAVCICVCARARMYIRACTSACVCVHQMMRVCVKETLQALKSYNAALLELYQYAIWKKCF